MKIIRWWGVITFFILAVLLAACWYLIAPMIIKGGIESAATESLGAKVEIDRLNLSLFPAGIEIKRLQATDPDLPMKNMVEVGLIKFAVDADALLWKKIQIDELNISGIQLGTERAKSGALTEGTARDQLSKEVASIELPELSEDDIKSMVEKADLVTLKRLKALDNSKQEMQAYWKSELESDTNKQRVKELEVEFKRLSQRAKENKMNLLADRKDWKKLKKAISQEKQKIKHLNDQYKLDKEKLKQQVTAVRAGPKDDLNAVMGDMGLNNGIAGLSDKFLGPEFTPWIEKLVGFMGSMKSEPQGTDEAPVYSTEQGLKVQFKDNQVFPDLLIKKVNLSGKDNTWSLSGDGTNLGYFPWLVGQPATLNLDVSGNGQATFSMVSDWKSEQQMLTQLNSNVDNWEVTNFDLMQTDLGRWVVNSGQLNSKLVGELSLEEVNLALSVVLKQPNISAPENLSGWQKTLANSLNQQKQLEVGLTVTGSLDEPKFKINSSLDKLFSEAIGQKVKQQAEKLKGKFSQAISEKVGDLGSLDQYSKDLEQWSDKLKVNDELLGKLKVKF